MPNAVVSSFDFDDGYALPLSRDLIKETLLSLAESDRSWHFEVRHVGRALSMAGHAGKCQRWSLKALGLRLGDILLDDRRLSQEDLDWALVAQEVRYQKHFRLGRVLYDLELLQPIAIRSALESQLHLAIFEIENWHEGELSVDLGPRGVLFDRRAGSVDVQSLFRMDERIPLLKRFESAVENNTDLSAIPNSYRLERDGFYRYRDSLGRIVGEIPC